ncbi:MAG: disulfide bond formation protein B [Sphingobacteriia bacterium]|nr:disulfide bond formation protein B [Sphingobacteriia bacterium]NCC38415.1 disulfide bond formation protein B [Gammaproteobacteria bacterium]
MSMPTSRLAWAILAAGAALATAFSLISTEWLDLDPCHLCIFQRLLFMILTITALAAFLGAGRDGAGLTGWLSGILTLPVATTGAGVAAHQSWLQLQPPDSVSCVAGPPGLIERMVEWLGQRAPDLFMATGLCEDEALNLLGLSLANWATILFLGALGVGVWALWRGRPWRAETPAKPGR